MSLSGGLASAGRRSPRHSPPGSGRASRSSASRSRSRTTSGYQSAGTAPPKVAGRPPGSSVFHSPAAEHPKTYGTPLDEFEDAPLPESRPVLPDEKPTGEQGAPTQNDLAQTTPPEWSPEEE